MKYIKDTNLIQLVDNEEFLEDIKHFFKGLVIGDYTEIEFNNYCTKPLSSDYQYLLKLFFAINKKDKRNIQSKIKRLSEYLKSQFPQYLVLIEKGFSESYIEGQLDVSVEVTII